MLLQIHVALDVVTDFPCPLGILDFIEGKDCPPCSLFFCLAEKWPDPDNKPWEKKLITVEVREPLNYWSAQTVLCLKQFFSLPEKVFCLLHIPLSNFMSDQTTKNCPLKGAVVSSTFQEAILSQYWLMAPREQSLNSSGDSCSLGCKRFFCPRASTECMLRNEKRILYKVTWKKPAWHVSLRWNLPSRACHCIWLLLPVLFLSQVVLTSLELLKNMAVVGGASSLQSVELQMSLEEMMETYWRTLLCLKRFIVYRIFCLILNLDDKVEHLRNNRVDVFWTFWIFIPH